MKLTDVLPLEKWVELEKEIVAKSGLNAGIYNVDGARITDYKKWANKLCPVVNSDKKGQTFICAPAHQNLVSMATAQKKGVAEECDAGIVKVVVPIFVDGEFLGTAGGCGLLFEDGEVEPFMVSKTLEMDEEEIEKLAEGMGTISESDAAALIDFIQEKIDKIVSDYKSSK